MENYIRERMKREIGLAQPINWRPTE
jgi:hypothetical protein